MKNKAIILLSLLSMTLVSCGEESVGVTSVSLNVSEYSIYFEDTYTLEATVYPETAVNKKVTWKSDNPEVVNVSDGKLIPYKKGTATITATSVDNGKTASCTVTVTDKTDKYGVRTNESVLSDANFVNGFGLKTPHQSPASVEKHLNYENENAGDYAWTIAQWWSPYDFANATLTKNDSVMNYKNTNRELEVDTSNGKITMALNGAAEYQYYEDTPEDEIDERLKNRAWPHFLLEQNFNSDLFLSPSEVYSEGGSIKVHFDVTINKVDQIKTGVASDCAQLLFYVSVYNRLQEGQTADEYGKNGARVAWVGVPILDTRYEYVDLYHALDTGMAGATGHLIYSCSSKSYMGETKPTIGKKYSVTVDLLEVIHDAFIYGQSSGLNSLYHWENLSIEYMNLGWEIPGSFDVSATFENLDIYVEY